MDKVKKETVQSIEKFLDENEELEFDDSVNISYADEEMRMIVKHDGKYLLLTLDNRTGSSLLKYEINESESVCIYDLLWIMEEIEVKMHKGV